MTVVCTISTDERLSNGEKNRIRDLFFSGYEYTLTDWNGQEVALSFAGGSRALDECMSLFQTPEIIAPAQFQGRMFSFKIDGRTFAIPLDSLTPVAE